MLTFKQYLSEAVNGDLEKIDVDKNRIEGNLEELNSSLDSLTERPYQNAPIFLAQLRGFFERFGVALPASLTNHFLDLSAEVAYSLGETGKYLYIVYDTNDDSFVDGYAQVVSKDELDDLLGLSGEGVLKSNRKLLNLRPSDWYRKRDDDAGNSNEY
jgi:hypothetical protein